MTLMIIILMKTIMIMLIITIIIKISCKCRQLSRCLCFQTSLFKHFRDDPRNNLRKVSSQIQSRLFLKRNLSTGIILLRHIKHSQPEQSSIGRCTSWQMPLISVYKTKTINKNSTDLPGLVTTMHLNKSNVDKFLYFPDSTL